MIRTITGTFFLAGAMAINALADSKTVPLSAAPAAVQKVIRAQAGDGELRDIDKTVDDGETIYDVGLVDKNGEDRDFTVAEDGTLLSVEVPPAELPDVVRQAVKALVGDGELQSVDKNLDDLETTYDVQWTTKDEKDKDVTIADDGAVLYAEKPLAEAPEAVRKQIADKLNGGKLESIYENFGETTNFDVEITTKAGKERGFTVELDGTLASEELKLGELSAPAQKTIKEQVGKGKIERIDKSFTKRDGILPYQVQATKDGKPFNFSVGPRGRFLGMDE